MSVVDPSRASCAALADLRVRRLLEERLLPCLYEDTVAVDVAAWSVNGEPVPRSEGLSGAFAPLPADGRWGTAWGTTWFRVRAEVPQRWVGKPVHLHVEINPAGKTGFCGEALAIDAAGRALQGVTPNHPDVLVAACAAGGQKIEYYLEAAANPGHPTRIYDWPLLSAEPGGLRLFSISCELVVIDPELQALIADVEALVGLLAGAHLDPARSGNVRGALGRACDAIDSLGVVNGLKRARGALEDALARPASASAHRVTACGHAHIDSAWLWPLREGRRKCLRTFATAVTLMDRYADYVFAASSAQHFAWVQQDDPVLFERIKQRVDEGRFVPVGGLWVECDVNVPMGESLVRQLVRGIRYFEDELGVRVEEVWLPDAFGFSPSLPQLMRLAGLSYFVSQKLSANERNPFPHSSFMWEGIDGSRVFAHFPPAQTYSGNMASDELTRGLEVLSQHEAVTRSLYLFGFGDGGGGPTAEMLEAARRLRSLEGSPAVEIGHPRSFLVEARAELDDTPVWCGELYFERHRGTYTSQSATKRGIRRAELGLRRAEVWSTLVPGALGAYPAEALETGWKTLLVSEFHDIAPGSSINWVHRQAVDELAAVDADADAMATSALERLAAFVDTARAAEPVLVANSQGHDREDLVTLPTSARVASELGSGTSLAAFDPQGVAAGPVQLLADGQLGFLAKVPSFGYSCYDLRSFEGAGAVPAGSLEVNDHRLENDRLRVLLDDDGLLVSVFDKVARREVLAGRGNVLQIFPDYPVNNDAWDIDATALAQPEEITDLVDLVVEEEGPVRATLRLTRRFGSSTITQRLSLTPTCRWLDLRSEVDWHERHRLLKVAFPLAVRSPHATYEVAFGLVDRPTHRNTSWDAARFEVCAHRFADLSEPGFGVALANDAKYGYDIAGNVMRLSLLRAPTAPDPLADQGHHRFSYRLVPHCDGLGPGGVVEAAHDLNDPLQALAMDSHRGELVPSASLLSSDAPNVVIDTVKRADDGRGIVIRCYEAWGGRGVTRISLPQGSTKAVRADLLEREVDEIPLMDGGFVEIELRPFEVVTLKIAGAPTQSIPGSAPGTSSDASSAQARRPPVPTALGSIPGIRVTSSQRPGRDPGDHLDRARHGGRNR